jgi:hypothetical protein
VGVDSTRWTVPLLFDDPFYRKAEISSKTYRAVDLRAGDLDADGRGELYASLRHTTYFPGALMKFDLKTGREMARYVHPGHFVHGSFEVENLDDDAAKELLIPGHSNAYGDAVLAVLDTRRIQGHSPVRGSYAVKGLQPAEHEAYLRFPTTIVGERSPRLLPFVRRTNANPRAEVFIAEVQDATLSGDDTSAYVLVTFTFGFDPVSVGTSSQYDRLARQLVEEGRLDAGPGNETFERYRQNIRYWTGDGWVTSAEREMSTSTSHVSFETVAARP